VRIHPPLSILYIFINTSTGSRPTMKIDRDSNGNLEFPNVTEEAGMRTETHSYILERFSMLSFDVFLVSHLIIFR
jgi:hypothetical protein